MGDLSFILADVFTDVAFGGNPLAVFPNADGLSPERMQVIARELNLSETVFVLPPTQASATHRLRIFTPAMELPFAGHPTIGTAIVLAELGLADAHAAALVFEEGAGLVPVELDRTDGGLCLATLTSPKLPERIQMSATVEQLASVTGLSPAEIEPITPRAYSAGVPFMFVPVADEAALAKVRIDTGTWSAVLADTPAPHLYLLTMANWEQGRAIRARMFAPAMGIAEDPATGGAAAALAGFLADIQRFEGRATWTIYQGLEMKRPSKISLEAVTEDGCLISVRVGGSAVLIAKGSLLSGGD